MLLLMGLMALVILPTSNSYPLLSKVRHTEIARITLNWTELKLPPPPAWVGDLPLFCMKTC